MVKGMNYNGYEITVDTERNGDDWRGCYTIRLNGEEIKSESHMFVLGAGTEVAADDSLFGMARAYADRHREGKEV